MVKTVSVKRFWNKYDNCEEDPYGETSPENVLAWLKQNG